MPVRFQSLESCVLTNTYTYLGSEGIIISYFNVLSEQCAVTITYWKIIAKFPFSRFGFWPNFPVMQRLFIFFFADAAFFHRNVIGFQFSAKKIFAKCNCFDNCQTIFFLSKLYLLILISLFKTNKERITQIWFIFTYLCHLSILLSLSPKKGRFCKKFFTNFVLLESQNNKVRS